MTEPVVVYEPKKAEVLPAEHSLAENEETIRDGLGTFVEVGQALMEIRDKRQYITAGFDRFEDYCRERWDMDGSYANTQIGASKVVGILRQGDLPVPANHEQARPLAKLLNTDGEEAVRVAWSQIVERHDGDGPVTGREVRTFLKPSLGITPSKRPLSDAYLGALDKLKPAMKSVRWALEQHGSKQTPKQVREHYAAYAETARALAQTMQALADGETFDRDELHERLDVGIWSR